MEISSNSNHIQVLSDAIQKKELNANLPTAIAANTADSQSTTTSSTVAISDEAMALQVKAAHDASKSTYVEKSVKEYEQMSYEALIDERNGATDTQWLDGPLKPIRSDGLAAQVATQKLANQRTENSFAAQDLAKALANFKTQLMKEHPEVKQSSFDITVKDGKLVIEGSGLPKDTVKTLQAALDDDKNSTAVNLKAAITKYNAAALTTINMQIYDEKGKFGGKDSVYVHRDDALKMDEFLKGISYNDVANSFGDYTYQRYSQAIGSTGYGNTMVYKSSQSSDQSK